MAQSATETVQIEVTVPTDAISGTVDTTVVTATSQADGDVWAAVTDITTVSDVCTPVQSVEISGPTTAVSGTAVTLNAVYTPTNASSVSLLWDNGETGSSASYTWTLEGQKTVVVTATAACGDPVNGTHIIDIAIAPRYRIHLPLVFRNY